MKKLCIGLFLLLPLAAHAQTAPPQPPTPPEPPKPDLVLLPRSAVLSLLQQVQAIATIHPELATTSVTTAFQQTNNCLADNPINGSVIRNGPDLCTAVTEELNTRTQEQQNTAARVADLSKQLEAAKAAAAPKPVPAPPPVPPKP